MFTGDLRASLVSGQGDFFLSLFLKKIFNKYEHWSRKSQMAFCFLQPSFTLFSAFTMPRLAGVMVSTVSTKACKLATRAISTKRRQLSYACETRQEWDETLFIYFTTDAICLLAHYGSQEKYIKIWTFKQTNIHTKATSNKSKVVKPKHIAWCLYFPFPYDSDDRCGKTLEAWLWYWEMVEGLKGRGKESGEETEACWPTLNLQVTTNSS